MPSNDASTQRAKATLSDLEAIRLHVGRFTLTAASLENSLNVLLVSLISGPGSPLSSWLAKQRMANKIDLFDALMPSPWSDGSRVTTALRRSNSRRNELAHSHWILDVTDRADSPEDWPIRLINAAKPRSDRAGVVLADLKREAQDQEILQHLVRDMTRMAKKPDPIPDAMEWARSWPTSRDDLRRTTAATYPDWEARVRSALR